MVELSSLSRTTIVPKEWFEQMYDPNYIAIIRDESTSTSIKFLQTPRYPKPQRVVSFNVLEPKQGSTNVLEVKKDPLLEFTCKKSSEISLGAIVRGFSPRVESLGLGFDASTNTFKMVCVLRKDDKNPCTMVHVLGTNTWREIPQVVPSCPIADKLFGSINPPNKIGGGWIDDTQLVDLNGEVGYICNYIINNGIDVWVLKQKEWTRLFRFDQGLCSFGVTKVLGRLNKDEYILVETTTCRGDRLIVLNVNNGVDLYDVKIAGHEDAHKEYVYVCRATSDRDTNKSACSINS
ncbi:hypothetical protein Tco_1068451 [Tanacetum coccineum]|uniref:F-box associated domain-containing protein n=1 Tax=Tanacetum coccineum TaxID=301880 RepID=A0ABQ5HGL9_9ASTR